MPVIESNASPAEPDGPGPAVVRPLTAAREVDGWAITERLLKDLTRLGDRVWLVADDVHALGPAGLGVTRGCW